ncbi:unnamed protein product (macronuclear) [Paramecium tetraurelia]|uniref:EF-hand domain-containing protein n=1 Tax=Paramecium tetraurelia TaxID=5888 RepID=A0E3V3_PARTE|nr:uncharacterized protein GSPATT00023143001 [Paramecium tetraurelia]CAK89970.1 unnamed protein product [Paramecium tetraurelia]|eukprot:XP_001457367.1 hypothetical protein (macronuclear) [Paramecium tetraurelia strain d4-2]
MQSPLRLYSAQRAFTCRNMETKPSFFISKSMIINHYPQRGQIIKETERNRQSQRIIINGQAIQQSTIRRKQTIKTANIALREIIKQTRKVTHFEQTIQGRIQTQRLRFTNKNENRRSTIIVILDMFRYCISKTNQRFQVQRLILLVANRGIKERHKKNKATRMSGQVLYILFKIECKVIKEVYEKLKFKYQALMHQIQFSQKDELLRDNIKISQELLITQQKLQELQLHNKKIQQDLHQSDFKRIRSEKLVFDKEKELKLIQFEYSNPKKTISDLNRQWQIRLENQKLIQQQLEDELRLRNEKIILLEKTLKEDKAAYQLKEAFYKREIDSLNIQIGQLKETIQHLEKEQMVEQSSDEQESKSEKSERQTSQSYQRQKTQLLMSRKKIQKVNSSEVEIIGKEIALKFQLAQIPFSRLDSYIYSKSSRGIINLNEINEILKQSPFDLPDDQSLLVARFLAEPEQEEWIYYDSYQTNDVVIVISIFRNLVKPFDLINPQLYDTIHQELKQIFRLNKNKLIDYLMLNGDNCDLNYFKKAFEYCDIPLSQEQEAYIAIKIYEKYRRIVNLKYQEIIDYFK